MADTKALYIPRKTFLATLISSSLLSVATDTGQNKKEGKDKTELGFSRKGPKYWESKPAGYF